MIFGVAGFIKSREHCCKSVQIAVTRPYRFAVLNCSGLLSRFRPGTAIVSGISSAVSSSFGKTLLVSCSSSEITTDCSSSCPVVFELTAVGLFDFDFVAEVSEV